jgi:hypothetical protein
MKLPPTTTIFRAACAAVRMRGRRSKTSRAYFVRSLTRRNCDYALNMILKDLLDVGAERTPILFGKLFQLGV